MNHNNTGIIQDLSDQALRRFCCEKLLEHVRFIFEFEGTKSVENMRVGIAISSYNRCELTRKTIEHIRFYTKTPYELVVVDDGSSDGTVDMLSKLGVDYLNGPNCGVVWTKNRAIFYLHEIRRCDVIILIEEDTFPIMEGWEKDWIEAALQWGHVNLAPAHWSLEDRLRGVGTPTDPIVSSYITGQCTAFSSEALSAVGYIDTRFKGYGYEHVEHSLRFVYAGWGGELNSEKNHFFYLIRSPLEVTCLDKGPVFTDLPHNQTVFEKINKESLHRWCWRTDEEMAIFYIAFKTLQKTNRPVPSISLKDWEISDDQLHPLIWDENQKKIIATVNLEDPRPRIIMTFDNNVASFRISGTQSRWINWSETGLPEISDVCQKSSELKMVCLRGKGVAFTRNELYLCAEHGDGNNLTITRREINEWETFHFLNFISTHKEGNNL